METWGMFKLLNPQLGDYTASCCKGSTEAKREIGS